MSTIQVTIERISKITPCPNADRLEIASILGTQTIVPKGQYHAGQRVIFFPPDLLIPPPIAIELGVQKYLKHAQFNGFKQQCRIAGCRLRGQPSYGFITGVLPELVVYPTGADVSEFFGAVKYEPPVVFSRAGDIEHDHPAFHMYTNIENYYRYPDTIPDGIQVRVTEKRHGTNCRVGLIKADEWQFMAGSHTTTRKQYDSKGTLSLYWMPLNENILSLLTDLCDEQHNVIVFGEIFGPGIQDMEYGLVEPTFEVFDISVDGVYLDWFEVALATGEHGVATVPLLDVAPFSADLVASLTNGPATGANHCREGIVVTPLVEQECSIGRMILKSVSADYLDR